MKPPVVQFYNYSYFCNCFLPSPHFQPSNRAPDFQKPRHFLTFVGRFLCLCLCLTTTRISKVMLMKPLYTFFLHLSLERRGDRWKERRKKLKIQSLSKWFSQNRDRAVHSKGATLQRFFFLGYNIKCTQRESKRQLLFQLKINANKGIYRRKLKCLLCSVKQLFTCQQAL